MKTLRIRTSVALLFCLTGFTLGHTVSADNHIEPSQSRAQDDAQGTDSVDGTGLNQSDAVLSVDGTGLGVMGTPADEPGTESVDGTGWRPSVDGTGLQHDVPANTGTSISQVVAPSDGTQSVDGTGIQSVEVPAALRGTEEALPDCAPAAEGSADTPEDCVPVSD